MYVCLYVFPWCTKKFPKLTERDCEAVSKENQDLEPGLSMTVSAVHKPADAHIKTLLKTLQRNNYFEMIILCFYGE